MNLYDKGYVWKMETPPANSNHLLEEEEENEDDKEEEEKEEEKIMAEDSEDSDSSLYQDTLSTHDPSTVSSSSSSPSSSSSSSYSFLSCEEDDNDEDDHHHNHQQEQSPPRSSSTGGRGKDLRLLFAPVINLATHINVVLTPLQEMMNFEDPHHRLNRKDPPIFAGRTLLSSTFHVAVPWRPTTIAHLARYLEMKLYEEQGLRKEPPPESASSSIWPWPFALYVRTAVNEYQPAVSSLTMDDLRRGPEHHRHLAYEPAYHLITLYYTHARELLRAMRRSSSPMKKKSKKKSKKSKEEKKKAKKEAKKAKKEKKKAKKRREEKKKAKKSRPQSAAFLPFTDGPSTSGAAAAAPPSLSSSSSSFSSSSSWSLGSD